MTKRETSATFSDCACGTRLEMRGSRFNNPAHHSGRFVVQWRGFGYDPTGWTIARCCATLAAAKSFMRGLREANCLPKSCVRVYVQTPSLFVCGPESMIHFCDGEHKNCGQGQAREC